ncbi:MAG: DNA primase [Bacteroidetes bacterium]|nr:MAG: DNA primase [Bacteroidota bacterium]
MTFDLKKQEIMEKISIVDTISEYVSLKQKGDKHWGLCPFHNEKTPSFTVTEDKNMFYCFGCHKGGNIFDFLIEVEGLSFFEAFKQLAEKAGVEIDSNKESPEDKQKSALLDLYNKICGSFNFILLNKTSSAYTRQYLQDRGISSDTINIFTLGYAPADRFWLHDFLISKNYSEEFLSYSGIFSSKNRRISLFSNRLIFPIINAQQDTIAFSGRKLKESDWGGKYINSPETNIYKKGETLYGIHASAKEIRKKKEVILVEGNFDVLAFYQSGLQNVVAPLGTAFTDKQAKYLKRYAKKCIIAFDSDNAGIEATLKSALILEKNGITNFVIPLPKGKDPSEILEKEGPEALNKLSKYPINTFEYLVGMAIDRYGLNNTEAKESIFHFLSPYMAGLSTELRKEESFRYLSEALGVDINTIFKDFAAIKRGINSYKVKEPVLEKVDEMHVSMDLFLMIALVENRKSFSSVRNTLDIDDLVDANAKKVYILLEEMYRRDDSYSKNLLSEIQDDNLRSLITYKLSTGEYKLNSHQIIADGVKKIKQRNFEKERSKIEILLRKTDPVTNRNELEKLLSEKKYLDEELLRIKGN